MDDDKYEEMVIKAMAAQAWTGLLASVGSYIPRTDPRPWSELKETYVGPVLCELIRMAAEKGYAVTGDDR